MGYWKTHTGLDGPPRDPTYDDLPILLGTLPSNGDPEEFVNTEADAKGIFSIHSSDPVLFAMKAQLLAAKLNTLKIPQFNDGQFASGTVSPTGENINTFEQAIAAADQLLDDVANGVPYRVSYAEAIKDLLDAANNGCPASTATPTSTPTPTPTPRAAGVVVGPTGDPSGLPNTGSSPGATGSWLRVLGIAVALLVLGGLATTAGRTGRREEG